MKKRLIFLFPFMVCASAGAIIPKARHLSDREKKELAIMVTSFYHECEPILRPTGKHPNIVAFRRCQQLNLQIACLLEDLNCKNRCWNWFVNIPKELRELEEIAPEGVSIPWQQPTT